MDTIKLETPRTAWDAFSALQDGRGDTAKTTRETVARIVRDQEAMIAALRERGIQIVEH